MWFEILPSFTICMVALSLPGYGLYFGHKYFLGTPYKRCLIDRWNRYNYQRDERLGNGNAYNLKGLEDIPDK